MKKLLILLLVGTYSINSAQVAMAVKYADGAQELDGLVTSKCR